MKWMTVEDDSGDELVVYVVPDNYRHDLNPDGLCRRCEPKVEQYPDSVLVIHYEDG